MESKRHLSTSVKDKPQRSVGCDHDFPAQIVSEQMVALMVKGHHFGLFCT